MIRHIALLEFNDAATAERIAQIRQELQALPSPGLIAYTLQRDLGLRPGNMDLAIVADFTDLDSYRAYDRDPEHDRIRRELIAPVVSRIERSQIEI